MSTVPRSTKVAQIEIADRDGDGRDDVTIWTGNRHIFDVAHGGRLLAHRLGDGAVEGCVDIAFWNGETGRFEVRHPQ